MCQSRAAVPSSSSSASSAFSPTPLLRCRLALLLLLLALSLHVANAAVAATIQSPMRIDQQRNPSEHPSTSTDDEWLEDEEELEEDEHESEPVAANADKERTGRSADMTGHRRLRLRNHKRRHRQKFHKEHTTEADQVYEMLTEEMGQDRLRYASKMRGTLRRERNEGLCALERRSVELGRDGYEYEPPFVVEIRCRSVADFEAGKTTTIQAQNCVHDLLRCVQQYSEVHITRRKVGSKHWHPHTLSSVPTGCECMWPVDKYGHQEL